MKELGRILAYAAAVVLVACLAAPPLFWLGRALVDAGLLPSLARFGFSKYFNRAALVAAVLLLWPFFRAAGLRRMSDLGLVPNPARWRDLGIGLAVGSLGLWSVAGLTVALGRTAWRAAWPLDAVPAILLSAAAVALIEESFFRGALLGLLSRTLSPRVALGVLSLLFASLHFVKLKRELSGEVGWLSGFSLLPALLWQYREPTLLAGGLLTLLLVGLVLGYAAQRTRSLYLGVGLHAGWVLALKGFGLVAERKSPPDWWLGRDLVTGLAPLLLLSLTWAGLAIWLERRRLPEAEVARV